jgi:hypothetical protein
MKTKKTNNLNNPNVARRSDDELHQILDPKNKVFEVSDGFRVVNDTTNENFFCVSRVEVSRFLSTQPDWINVSIREVKEFPSFLFY